MKVSIDKAGTITIRVTKARLKKAAIHLPDFERYDETSGDFLIPKIKDPLLFAKEVCRQLNEEEEDGTTMVHRMFDAAFIEAVEQGAEGIIFPDDKGYGRKVSSQ